MLMFSAVWAPGAGIPTMVLRFAAFIPLSNYKTFAEVSSNLVQTHNTLQQPSYNPLVLQAEHIASKWVS